jgi:hypothetical protein
VAVTPHKFIEMSKVGLKPKAIAQDFMTQIQEMLGSRSKVLLFAGAHGSDEAFMHACVKEGVPYEVYLPFPLKVYLEKAHTKWVKALPLYVEKAQKVHVLHAEYHPYMYHNRIWKMFHESDLISTLWGPHTHPGTRFTVEEFMNKTGWSRPLLNIYSKLSRVSPASIAA